MKKAMKMAREMATKMMEKAMKMAREMTTKMMKRATKKNVVKNQKVRI